jgi:DNA invertase Pin-like site-specific DNA recombinase
MSAYSDGKIAHHHLNRQALIYVRQSSMKQVMENTESTARQYALVDQAQALGWSRDLIEVIDDDLGKSGTTAAHRNGFQRLVADVAMGQVGIVMGLEMSRLARNNADFQQLLHLCGSNNTLIYDADAVYDLMHLNDRLVLGLKGTLSEVELFTIRARLQGGALSKAARGELRIKLPIGFVYSPGGQVELDPDRQVQATIRLFFEVFRRLGSCKGVVRHFNREAMTFPVRPIKGPDKGELTWRPLSNGLALRVLHNPRYAGAYAYGRTKIRKSSSGGIAYSRRERDQWHALLKDAHPGYISWDEFEANEARLAGNARRDQGGAVREGCALLQGLVLCGHCGRNFATTYKQKAQGERTPVYLCNRDQLDYGKPICTSIPGAGIDAIVARVLLENVTPVALDAALAVQQEIIKRTTEANRLVRLQVDRAQYEADLARKRVMAVDPGNRLVAETLETEWNDKLTVLKQVRQDYERRRDTHQCVLDPTRQAQIKEIVGDFSAIWSHPATTFQDQKRMIRLLVNDVTLTREDHQVEVAIRFKTGAIVTEQFKIPRSGNQLTVIDPQIIQRIDTLSSTRTAGEIATELNRTGVSHPTLQAFTTNAVVYLMKRFNLATRYDRLRALGYVSQEELAASCGVQSQTIRRWCGEGWLQRERYNDQPEYLYKPDFSGLPYDIACRYPAILSANQGGHDLDSRQWA